MSVFEMRSEIYLSLPSVNNAASKLANLMRSSKCDSRSFLRNFVASKMVPQLVQTIYRDSCCSSTQWIWEFSEQINELQLGKQISAR